jgi:intracellular septation protein A
MRYIWKDYVVIIIMGTSTSFFSNISYYKNKSAVHYNKFKQVFTYSTRYSCQILIKLEFSHQNFGKNTQITIFMKIGSLQADLFHADVRKDRRT